MKLVTADQRTPEWYIARLGRATGSRFKDIMAVKKDGSPTEKYLSYKKELVAERIVGEMGKADVFMTDAMKWGQINEGLARTEYMLRTGHKVTPEGFAQHDDLMIGVSTDGLVDDTGNLEIKCLMPHNHLYNIAMNGEMPDDYRDQVQGQMWVTGRYWCDFVGYDSRMPKGLDLVVTRVLRDDDYIMKLEARVGEFLDDVRRDLAFFLRFLPVCERLCRTCGWIFTDKLLLCPACKTNNTELRKVLEPAERKLIGDETLHRVLGSKS